MNRNALTVLERRYLLRDEPGVHVPEVVASPGSVSMAVDVM